MNAKPKIFSGESARNLSVDSLLKIFKELGCEKVILKRLSPNDNSKNQPYFGPHLTDLSFIPLKEVKASESTSQKKSSKIKGAKFTANISFAWLDAEGKIYSAPHSKLIYYPQYPEVRFSGFLQGCKIDSDGWMDPSKNGRTEGRVLVLGVSQVNKSCYGYLSIPDSRIGKETLQKQTKKQTNIFELLWDSQVVEEEKSSTELLLEALAGIHNKGWIQSQRLTKDGTIINYTAQNGGGYTLEAELGIIPNGSSSPDFLGWEVKQFQVKNFLNAFQGKALTLLTPEPTGGYYVEKGVSDFIHKYGRRSTTKADRYDFCGRHFAQKNCASTGLTLNVQGYDGSSNCLYDSQGEICLIDVHENVAASWSFAKIIEHWNKKHAHAVYVPSKKKKIAPIKYKYSNLIRLYSSTNINLFLTSVSQGCTYYDPGIKLVNASTNPKMKRRSQFRVHAKNLDSLYLNRQDVDLMSCV